MVDWQSLEHTWTRDLRDPLYTFELGNGDTWGFYGMSLVGWHVLLAVRNQAESSHCICAWSSLCRLGSVFLSFSIRL